MLNPQTNLLWKLLAALPKNKVHGVKCQIAGPETLFPSLPNAATNAVHVLDVALPVFSPPPPYFLPSTELPLFVFAFVVSWRCPLCQFACYLAFVLALNCILPWPAFLCRGGCRGGVSISLCVLINCFLPHILTSFLCLSASASASVFVVLVYLRICLSNYQSAACSLDQLQIQVR